MNHGGHIAVVLGFGALQHHLDFGCHQIIKGRHQQDAIIGLFWFADAPKINAAKKRQFDARLLHIARCERHPRIALILKRRGIGHKGKCCANGLSIKRPVRKKVKIHGFAVTQPQRNGSAAIQYEPQL